MVIVALLMIALGSTSAAADVSGPSIVSFLNAQRGAQQIPAGIVEDPKLSDGCAKHNNYDRLNNTLVHSEDPSRPGYTPEGDQAARSSVLYSGGPWTSQSNPFEHAPIHLHQLLAPRLDRMGASENQGYGCATTLASRNRPAPPSDVTYTYPGNGAAGWRSAETAAEGPYTPGERVGIPAGTKTGPYLYVMFDGPDMTPFDTATATGASLTGPSGAVAIAVVDNHTSGLESYLPNGMEVIPRSPLQPGARYTATVTANVTTRGGQSPGRAFTHSWSFTTSGPTPTPTPSPSPTPSPTPTATATRSPSPTPSPTPTPSTSPTPSPTPTPTATRSPSPTPSPTPTPTATVSPTPTVSSTATSTPTSTPEPNDPFSGWWVLGDTSIFEDPVGDPPSVPVIDVSNAALYGRDLRVVAGCDDTCDLVADGTVRAGRSKARLIGTERFLHGGGPATLHLRMRRATARRLRHRTRLRFLVVLRAEAPNGGGAVLRWPFTLRR